VRRAHKKAFQDMFVADVWLLVVMTRKFNADLTCSKYRTVLDLAAGSIACGSVASNLNKKDVMNFRLNNWLFWLFLDVKAPWFWDMLRSLAALTSL
jgi:hypothetical protein